MRRCRLYVVGGFLGAGKTTALVRLANDFMAAERRVGLITNDQADNLVDTGSARAAGLRVEEVAGACFCCKFDDLAAAAERIRAEERPDVILGEPVGSCTDLSATVVAPFERLYGDRYTVAPYSVLVDPERVRQILLERGFGGFSAKVAYIFAKQLEEAEIICLNKVDTLADDERDRLCEALRAEFPRARVIAIAGRTGAGFDAWRTLLEEDGAANRNIVEIDYDTYAEGEAELGWLNMDLALDAGAPFDSDALARDLVDSLVDALAQGGHEIAHLKTLIETEQGSSVANSVSGTSRGSVSRAASGPATTGRLVLNARVHVDPARLAALATETIGTVLPRAGVAWQVRETTHFRPGRPVPTHRDPAASV